MQRSPGAPGLAALVWIPLLGLLLAACSQTSPGPSGATTAPPTTTAKATSTSTSTTTPCEPGGRTITLQGVRVRQFCGTAQVEVRVANETVLFRGGECARHEDWLAVNIGFEVIDAIRPEDVEDPDFRSFTLLMGRHPLAGPDATPVAGDGVYTEGLITFAVPGRGVLVEDKTITLAATRTVGTFTGTGFAGDTADQPLEVAGTLTCDAGAIPLEEVPALVETLADE
ncbi:MAG: hypothetical protein HYU28_11160 [Actinobacteria bacterium]|nr:hypothetical protein [Actinomycetota bacterium]